MRTSGTLQIVRAGLVEYHEALEIQHRFCEQVKRDRKRAFLVLLEHPPVFTLGKNADAGNVLDSDGIPVVMTDRGGDVTYHGPGQLVGYPIFDLRERRLGVRSHVEAVEEALIRGLRLLGLDADRKPGFPGVWHRGAKIAALGIRIDRGVTRHGFALNVNGSLEPFRRIRPCGLRDVDVTSIAEATGKRVGMEEAAEAVVSSFMRVFRFSACSVSTSL